MKTRDILRLLLLAAIWGSSFLFLRVASPVIGAIPTAFSRALLSSLGLAGIFLAMRVKWQFKGLFGAALALGVVNSAIPFVMYSLAAKALPANYSAIFNATTPLMGVVMGSLFFGERLTVSKLMGVVLGLAGVAVLTGAGPVALTPDVMWGAAECLIATSCYGLASFLTRAWISNKGGLDSKLVAMVSQFGACLAMLPVIVYTSSTQTPTAYAEVDSSVWLALLALGLLCTAFAYILYFQLIANIGPVKSLTVTFLIPLFGALWGTLFLHEHLTPAHLAGGLLIAAAIWMVLRPTGNTLPRPSGRTVP